MVASIFELLFWPWDGAACAASKTPAPRPVATKARREGSGLVRDIDVLLLRKIGWPLDRPTALRRTRQENEDSWCAIFFFPTVDGAGNPGRQHPDRLPALPMRELCWPERTEKGMAGLVSPGQTLRGCKTRAVRHGYA
jgi:hypothetical protein